MKTCLHVGCGYEPLPDFIEGYQEIRLDIDSDVSPDICASSLDMGDIGEFDMVYCCHSLEHVYDHEVHTVLSEFKRALKKGGHAIIFVPNLTDVKCDDTVLYDSPAGPITGKDMYYGMARLVESNHYYAHKTGFTLETLRGKMEEVFSKVDTSLPSPYDIMGVGFK